MPTKKPCVCKNVCASTFHFLNTPQDARQAARLTLLSPFDLVVLSSLACYLLLLCTCICTYCILYMYMYMYIYTYMCTCASCTVHVQCTYMHMYIIVKEHDPNWDAWANASQLGSCYYFVGSCGPTHPSHPMISSTTSASRYEILVAKQLPTNVYACTCTVYLYML